MGRVGGIEHIGYIGYIEYIGYIGYIEYESRILFLTAAFFKPRKHT